MATRATSSSSPSPARQGQTQQSLEEALRTERSEALRRVSASSKLLEECIIARERLDSANSRIRALRSRTTLLEEGQGSDEAATVSSAVPVAQEFSTKMAELARVAPGLSALLVSATERLGEATPGTGPSSSGPADRGRGTESPRTPPADEVHEVLKVVLPALAQLLSFDHLRASGPVARNLVQALVNLYVSVGCASPGGGGGCGNEESQASHGSGRSSAEGTPSSSNKCASPLVSSAGGTGSGGGKSGQPQRDRMAKKTASWVTNILTQAITPKVYGGAAVRSPGLDALLGENGVDSMQHHQAVQAELLHNTQVLQGFAEEDLASRRSRRRESGGGDGEDPLERLFETTLEAFGSMLQLGEDDDGEPPAMQFLLARLQEDSYRMLAGREIDRETGAGELKGPCLAYLEEPPLLHCRQSRIEQQGASSTLSSAPSQSTAATFSAGKPRKHPLPGSSPPSAQKRRSFPGPFPAPHPPPREWEGRVRYCLVELKRRPFLCPDEMLRSTGAVPSLAPEAYTGDDAWRRAPNGECQHTDGFMLSQVCLLLALDLIEEAVLEEGGGEAEAGLLRALRTPRIGGVGVEVGMPLALGGQARGRMDGAELSALVGLLEERPSGCPENGLAALAWALQDIGQRYGNSGPPCDNKNGPSFRPFEVELWLLLVGYRHWIMLAMVQLLSAGRCDACKTVKPLTKRNVSEKTPETATGKVETIQGDVNELAEKAPAHWLLAWYACGGYTKPASLLEEAVKAMQQAATCLDDSGSPIDREGLVVEKALESAEKSGQGLVGEAFTPCTALAWLLTSRVALDECEQVLAHSVLRSEDLKAVFEDRRSIDSLWRSRKEVILQGIAALEDMVWLAGLRPPLRHIHAGRDLRNLLERVRVWLADVGGGWRKRDERSEATSRTTFVGKDVVSTYCDVLFDDFSERRDGICRSLASLAIQDTAFSQRGAKKQGIPPPDLILTVGLARHAAKFQWKGANERDLTDCIASNRSPADHHPRIET